MAVMYLPDNFKTASKYKSELLNQQTTEEMKALRNLVMMTVVLGLAACSSDENEVLDGSVAAKVTANIDGVQTRAAGTTWETDDEIGISVTSTTGETKGTNVLYTISNTSSGSFSSENPIYFQDMIEVTFSAYYPYDANGGTISKTITAAEQETEAQKKIDYMFASGAKASKKSPVANFTFPEGGTDARFKHCMSQVIFTFKQGADTDLKGMTDFTVSGLKMAGTFNTADGTATATADAAADLKITETPSQSDTHTRSLILFPQDVTDSKFNLSLTLGGQTYKAELSIPNSGTALVSGNKYTYTITVNKTKLTVSQATIADWGNGGSKDGNAEMQ